MQKMSMLEWDFFYKEQQICFYTYLQPSTSEVTLRDQCR